MRKLVVSTLAVLGLVVLIVSCSKGRSVGVVSVDSLFVEVSYGIPVGQAAAKVGIVLDEFADRAMVVPHEQSSERCYLYLIGLSKQVSARSATKIIRSIGMEPANIMELFAFRAAAGDSMPSQPIVALDSISFVTDTDGYIHGPCLEWSSLDYYVVAAGENGAWNNSGFDAGYLFLARR
jgi:hypothetical protein